MTGSEVRYVNSGGVHIAYRVFGDGPLDRPSPASSTILARLAARCGVVWARTRRSSSARSALAITSGGMVGIRRLLMLRH